MNEQLQNLIKQTQALATQYPYVAGGIALFYLIFLIRKPKGTISFTLLGLIALVVGLWFKTMFVKKDDNKNWNRYENQRLEQIDKSGE